MKTWIKHFLGLHKWLPILVLPENKVSNGNFACRDCPRMSYIGPFGDGMEDYPVSVEEWNKHLAWTVPPQNA